MSGENPCNICEMNCDEMECVFHRIYNKCNYCKAYDCMANYEGDCLLGLFDDCGCRKQHEKD